MIQADAEAQESDKRRGRGQRRGKQANDHMEYDFMNAF